MKASRIPLLPLMVILFHTQALAGSPKLETASFAAGCYWGTEEVFRKIPGVMETRVGFEGGSQKADYEEVSSGGTGHAETLELKFDPKKVSYRELLHTFFEMHDPTTLNRQGNDSGTQYRSAIFTQNAEQMKEAKAYKAMVEKSGAWKKPITTEITPATSFYPAEEDHQKFLVKNPKGSPRYYDNHYLRDLNFESGDNKK